MEDRETKMEIVILIVALIITTFCIVKYGNKNGNEQVAELPLVYVQTSVIRGEDYVLVEYKGNEYSAYIGTESNIQTGDLVWAGFYINDDRLTLINIKSDGKEM